MSDQAESLQRMRAAVAQEVARQDWNEVAEKARALRAVYPDAWEGEYYAARAMVESGAYEHADQTLLLAMDRFPTQPQLAILYGQSASRSRTPADAIDRWTTIQSHFPAQAEAWIGLAQAHRAANDFDRADQVLAEGIERNPTHVVLLTRYAALAYQREQWPAALQRWQAVRAAAPDRHDADLFIADCLRELGRLDESDDALRQAMASRPADAKLAASYASTAVARADWPEAVQRWRRLLAIAPTNVGGTAGLARALHRLGQTAEAEETLRGGLSHEPRNEQLLTRYATLATRNEDWPEAASRWHAVYEHCPARPGTYSHYVQALEQIGALGQADTVVREALEFAPANQGLLVQAATIAEKRADLPESARRWRQAAELFPDDETVQAGLARIASAVDAQAAAAEQQAHQQAMLAAAEAQAEAFDRHDSVPVRAAIPLTQAPEPVRAGALQRFGQSLGRFLRRE